MEKWIKTEDRMPEQLDDILFLTKSGNIHKGCLNLRNTWIIQNTDGLIAKYLLDSSDVIGWMPVPDDGFTRMSDSAPAPGSRVLSKDRLDGHVVIVDVCKNCWIIRNMPGDHITFTIWNHEDNLWKPLPEKAA